MTSSSALRCPTPVRIRMTLLVGPTCGTRLMLLLRLLMLARMILMTRRMASLIMAHLMSRLLLILLLLFSRALLGSSFLFLTPLLGHSLAAAMAAAHSLSRWLARQ